MFDRFSLADLSTSVLAAPMAAGPSTPELAAAVTKAAPAADIVRELVG
jgi:NAD(P)H-dependent flavin oxidoreductase YrpB (nitropropane dioxygenase family)